MTKCNFNVISSIITSVSDVPFRIAQGARRYGVSDEDMLHACRNAISVHEEDDILMYVGADRSGNPLEVGVVAEDEYFKVIHAMPARAKYLR